jgi:hypothetical protein
LIPDPVAPGATGAGGVTGPGFGSPTWVVVVVLPLGRMRRKPALSSGSASYGSPGRFGLMTIEDGSRGLPGGWAAANHPIENRKRSGVSQNLMS